LYFGLWDDKLFQARQVMLDFKGILNDDPEHKQAAVLLLNLLCGAVIVVSKRTLLP